MLIFLYGTDDYRSRKKLNEFKDKFVREIDASGQNIITLEGEKVEYGRIREAISASSLLVKKNLVIVKNVFENKSETIFEELSAMIKDKKFAKNENIIIFWDRVASGDKLAKGKAALFKILAKEKYAQEFKALSNTEAAAWVKKEAEERGGKISREAAAELCGLTGNDFWQISQEIDKLVNYKAGQKLQIGESEKDFQIEVADVKELVSGVFDEKIFALTDAISNKNRAQAFKLFEEQLASGNAGEYILHMISRQIRILLMVRQALDSGVNPRRLGSELKLHPYVAQKSAAQAAKFKLNDLKNIFSRLVEIDYLLKTGQAEANSALNLLMVKI